MKLWRLLSVVVCVLIAQAWARAELSVQVQEALLAEATEAFDAGVRQRDSDPQAAEAALDRSIAAFTRLVEEGGIESGRLYYNLGNAWFLRGDLGRAIANFRRAQELLPNDENVASNLEWARRRVPDRIPPTTRKQILTTIFFWHYDVPARVRFGAFMVCNVVLWSLLGLGLLGRMRMRWPAVVMGVAVVVLGSSLGIEEKSRQAHDEGVIVQAEVVGRKGPDASAYQPSFREPLHAGVEFFVVEERPGWVLVRLHDDRETWLPAAAVERI